MAEFLLDDVLQRQAPKNEILVSDVLGQGGMEQEGGIKNYLQSFKKSYATAGEALGNVIDGDPYRVNKNEVPLFADSNTGWETDESGNMIPVDKRSVSDIRQEQKDSTRREVGSTIRNYWKDVEGGKFAKGSVGSYIGAVIENAPRFLIYMAPHLLPGGGEISNALMYKETHDSRVKELMDLRDQGKIKATDEQIYDNAAKYGLAEALPEYATDKIEANILKWAGSKIPVLSAAPLVGRFIKKVTAQATGEGLIKTMFPTVAQTAKTALKVGAADMPLEALGEYTTEHFQGNLDLDIGSAKVPEGMTKEEYLQDRKNFAAIVGALSGGVMGSGMHTVHAISSNPETKSFKSAIESPINLENEDEIKTRTDATLSLLGIIKKSEISQDEKDNANINVLTALADNKAINVKDIFAEPTIDKQEQTDPSGEATVDTTSQAIQENKNQLNQANEAIASQPGSMVDPLVSLEQSKASLIRDLQKETDGDVQSAIADQIKEIDQTIAEIKGEQDAQSGQTTNQEPSQPDVNRDGISNDAQQEGGVQRESEAQRQDVSTLQGNGQDVASGQTTPEAQVVSPVEQTVTPMAPVYSSVLAMPDGETYQNVESEKADLSNKLADNSKGNTIINSRSIPDHVANVFERLQGLMGFSTKTVMLTKSELANSEFGSYLMSLVSENASRPDSISGGRFYNSAIDPKTGKRFYIAVVDDAVMKDDLLTQAVTMHEAMGHGVFYEFYDQAPQPIKNKIEEDFKRFYTTLENWANLSEEEKTQFHNEFSERVVSKFLNKEQVYGGKLNRESMFREWLAHQISKAINSSKPAQTVMERFWNKVAEKIKALYSVFKEQNLDLVTGVKSVRDFVDYLYRNKNTVNVENFNIKGTSSEIATIKAILLDTITLQNGKLVFAQEWLTPNTKMAKTAMRLKQFQMNLRQPDGTISKSPITEGITRNSIYSVFMTQSGDAQVVRRSKDSKTDKMVTEEVLLTIPKAMLPNLPGEGTIKGGKALAGHVRDALIVMNSIRGYGLTKETRETGKRITGQIFVDKVAKALGHTLRVSASDKVRLEELMAIALEQASVQGISPQQIFLNMLSGQGSVMYELQKTGIKGFTPTAKDKADLPKRLIQSFREFQQRFPALYQEFWENATAPAVDVGIEAELERAVEEETATPDVQVEPLSPMQQHVQAFLDMYVNGLWNNKRPSQRVRDPQKILEKVLLTYVDQNGKDTNEMIKWNAKGLEYLKAATLMKVEELSGTPLVISPTNKTAVELNRELKGELVSDDLSVTDESLSDDIILEQFNNLTESTSDDLNIKQVSKKKSVSMRKEGPYAHVLKESVKSKKPKTRKPIDPVKLKARRDKLVSLVHAMKTLREQADKNNRSLFKEMQAQLKPDGTRLYSDKEIATKIATYHRAISKYSQNEVILRLANHLGFADHNGMDQLSTVIRMLFPDVQSPKYDELGNPIFKPDGTAEMITIPGSDGTLASLGPAAKDQLIYALQRLTKDSSGRMYDVFNEQSTRERMAELKTKEQDMGHLEGFAKFGKSLIDSGATTLSTTKIGKELVSKLNRFLLKSTLYQRNYLMQLESYGKEYKTEAQRDYLYGLLDGTNQPKNQREQDFIKLIKTINVMFASELANHQVSIQYRNGRKEVFKFDLQKALDYFPHMWEPGAFQNPSDKMIQSLIDGGTAANRQHAINIIKQYGNQYIKVSKMANIEMARETELGGWMTDPIKVYQRYITGSSKRLALLDEFGNQPEFALAQYALKHFKEGTSSEGLNDARYYINKTVGSRVEDNLSPEANKSLASSVMLATGLMLQHAAIVQPGVAANMAGVAGFKNVSKAIAMVIANTQVEQSPGKFIGSREYAELAGVLNFTMNKELYDILQSDKTRETTDKILRSFGITQVDSAMRLVGGITGKLYAAELAIEFYKKPSGKNRYKIEKLGLDPDLILSRDPKTEPLVTFEELRLAALAFTEQTNFVSNPMTTPAILKGHPLGKVFWLFSRFAFQQHHFMLDLVKNNKGAALKAILAGLGVGVPSALLRMLAKGDDPEEILKKEGPARMLWKALQGSGVMGMYVEMIVNAALGVAGKVAGGDNPAPISQSWAPNVPAVKLLETLGKGVIGAAKLASDEGSEDSNINKIYNGTMTALQISALTMLPTSVGVPLNAAMGVPRAFVERTLFPNQSQKNTALIK